MGQVPTSQSRPRDADHLRPSNWAARTLGGAYALQVWWRSVSCEARNHGSGEVLCAKSTFFLVDAVNRNDPSLPTALLAGFSTMKGVPVLFSDFGYDNSWPYPPVSTANTGMISTVPGVSIVQCYSSVFFFVCTYMLRSVYASKCTCYRFYVYDFALYSVMVLERLLLNIEAFLPRAWGRIT